MSFTPRNYQIKLDADSDEAWQNGHRVKRCCRCGVTLDLLSFHADNRNKVDGKQAICKSCKSRQSEDKRRVAGVKPLVRNNPDATYKFCTRCRLPKYITDFPVDVRTCDRRASECLTCKATNSNRTNRQRGVVERVLQKPNATHKTCKTCCQSKPVVLFYETRHGRNRDGRMAHCVECWLVKSGRTRCNLKDYYAQYSAARRNSLRHAEPNWLTNEQRLQIRMFYWLAADCRAVTGEVYEVDHITPINGKNVCGLHVPWNLQVLPMSVNRTKSNRILE